MKSYDVSIFIVTEDNEIVEVIENDYETIVSDGRFVMITNDLLNSDCGENNTIYISKNWYDHLNGVNLNSSLFEMRTMDNTEIIAKIPNDEKYWFIYQGDLQEVPNVIYINNDDEALMDFNGYNNTMNCISYADKLMRHHNDCKSKEPNNKRLFDTITLFSIDNIQAMYPAIFAAYTSTERFNGHTSHCYIPALGQLKIIQEWYIEINHALEMMQPEKLLDFNTKKEYLWSSTSFDDNIQYSLHTRKIRKEQKTHHLHIMPIFALK